jgi:hypothetical protein
MESILSQFNLNNLFWVKCQISTAADMTTLDFNEIL